MAGVAQPRSSGRRLVISHRQAVFGMQCRQSLGGARPSTRSVPQQSRVCTNSKPWSRNVLNFIYRLSTSRWNQIMYIFVKKSHGYTPKYIQHQNPCHRATAQSKSCPFLAATALAQCARRLQARVKARGDRRNRNARRQPQASRQLARHGRVAVAAHGRDGRRGRVRRVA